MAEQRNRQITGVSFGDGGVSLGLNGSVRLGLRLGQSGCPASMTFTEEPRGVLLSWKSPQGEHAKLVTWNHIREVDYATATPVELKPEVAATVRK